MTRVEPDAGVGVAREVVRLGPEVTLPGEDIDLGGGRSVGRGVDPGLSALTGEGPAERLTGGVGEVGVGIGVGVVAGGEAFRALVND